MKRVRVTLGQRQVEALIDAALMGIEDLDDHRDPDLRRTARLADAALGRIIEAQRKVTA